MIHTEAGKTVAEYNRLNQIPPNTDSSLVDMLD
jgi:hypothetical protein